MPTDNLAWREPKLAMPFLGATGCRQVITGFHSCIEFLYFFFHLKYFDTNI